MLRFTDATVSAQSSKITLVEDLLEEADEMKTAWGCSNSDPEAWVERLQHSGSNLASGMIQPLNAFVIDEQ